MAVDRLGLGGSPAGPSAPAMSGEVARAAGAVSVSSLGSSITAAWNAPASVEEEGGRRAQWAGILAFSEVEGPGCR